MRAAIVSSSPAATRYPVSPSATASRAPPTSVTTTARPAAMYSRIELEKPSAFELRTHTSETASSSATRVQRPVKKVSRPTPELFRLPAQGVRQLPFASEHKSGVRHALLHTLCRAQEGRVVFHVVLQVGDDGDEAARRVIGQAERGQHVIAARALRRRDARRVEPVVNGHDLGPSGRRPTQGGARPPRN